MCTVRRTAPHTKKHVGMRIKRVTFNESLLQSAYTTGDVMYTHHTEEACDCARAAQLIDLFCMSSNTQTHTHTHSPPHHIWNRARVPNRVVKRSKQTNDNAHTRRAGACRSMPGPSSWSWRISSRRRAQSGFCSPAAFVVAVWSLCPVSLLVAGRCSSLRPRFFCFFGCNAVEQPQPQVHVNGPGLHA